MVVNRAVQQLVKRMMVLVILLAVAVPPPAHAEESSVQAAGWADTGLYFVASFRGTAGLGVLVIHAMDGLGMASHPPGVGERVLSGLLCRESCSSFDSLPFEMSIAESGDGSLRVLIPTLGLLAATVRPQEEPSDAIFSRCLMADSSGLELESDATVSALAGSAWAVSMDFTVDDGHDNEVSLECGAIAMVRATASFMSRASR